MENYENEHIKMIDLVNSCQNEITQDHLKIIKIVIKIDNKRALNTLHNLSKSVLKKSNSF